MTETKATYVKLAKELVRRAFSPAPEKAYSFEVMDDMVKRAALAEMIIENIEARYADAPDGEVIGAMIAGDLGAALVEFADYSEADVWEDFLKTEAELYEKLEMRNKEARKGRPAKVSTEIIWMAIEVLGNRATVRSVKKLVGGNTDHIARTLREHKEHMRNV